MNISISRFNDEMMVTNIDLTDIKDKGEIAHCICELERAKLRLLMEWEKRL